MLRRDFLKMSAVLTGSMAMNATATTLPQTSPASAATVDERPNILLILTDQQSKRMMSCAGNTDLQTPAMDRLASEGIRFGRAYCANPVCMPARFSLMTGRMPSEIGVSSNLFPKTKSVPDAIRQSGIGHLLRDAGYETAYGGKVHLPEMSAVDIGFDYISEDEREQLAGDCLEFMRERPGDKPFFLVASFINPHDICYMAIRDSSQTEAEKRLVERGGKAIGALDEALKRPTDVDEETFFANHCPNLPKNFEPPDDEPEAIRMMLEQRPFRLKARQEWDEKRWREHRWAYARLTERVDRQIGELLDGMRQSGLLENTLIILTSDHGDMDDSRRMEHKSTLYDEACKVPLIIWLPGGGNGGRVDDEHPVSSGLDVLPTICDWAGTNWPPYLKGASLRGVVMGEDAHGRDSVPIECAIGRAVVTSRFKYARYDIGKNAEQLFDTMTDPLEQTNLIHNPDHATDAKQMRALFDVHFGGQTRDPEQILKEAAQA